MSFTPVYFKPEHPVLKRHIRYFYFLISDKDSFESQYFAFPHIDTVLNIHQQVSFDIDGKRTKVWGNPEGKTALLVQGIRDFPLLAQLGGRLNKVTIIFKPLGINHFGVPNFGKEYTMPSQPFVSWEKRADFQKFINEFFFISDIHQRASYLENFLISLFDPPLELDILNSAIDKLIANPAISVSLLSDAVGLTTKTINRLFMRYLGVPPRTFKKVAQFRKSLENHQVERLTDLAYKSNYYDQAYFNKIYKALTGSNPLRFFKEIERLADDQLIFQFFKGDLSEKYNSKQK